MYNLLRRKGDGMSYLLIGKITGFKGLKGEMKIKPLSGFMVERLVKNAKVYIKINDKFKPFVVKSYHEKQKNPLLILKGYEHLDLVEDFKQREIYVDGEAPLELPDDTYHQDELIGMKVYQGQAFKGYVVDIKNYPVDDYLVVKVNEKDVLIPFRDEFIQSMDKECIVIIDMEGLF